MAAGQIDQTPGLGEPLLASGRVSGRIGFVEMCGGDVVVSQHGYAGILAEERFALFPVGTVMIDDQAIAIDRVRINAGHNTAIAEIAVKILAQDGRGKAQGLEQIVHPGNIVADGIAIGHGLVADGDRSVLHQER